VTVDALGYTGISNAEIFITKISSHFLGEIIGYASASFVSKGIVAFAINIGTIHIYIDIIFCITQANHAVDGKSIVYWKFVITVDHDGHYINIAIVCIDAIVYIFQIGSLIGQFKFGAEVAELTTEGYGTTKTSIGIPFIFNASHILSHPSGTYANASIPRIIRVFLKSGDATFMVLQLLAVGAQLLVLLSLGRVQIINLLLACFRATSVHFFARATGQCYACGQYKS